jgi:hypothetical protein
MSSLTPPFFLVVMVLGFELKADALPFEPFHKPLVEYFQDRVSQNIWPGLALSHIPSDLCFLSS